MVLRILRIACLGGVCYIVECAVREGMNRDYAPRCRFSIKFSKSSCLISMTDVSKLSCFT